MHNRSGTLRWLIIGVMAALLAAQFAPPARAGDEPADLLKKAQERARQIASDKQNAKSALELVYLQKEEAVVQLQVAQQEKEQASAQVAVLEVQLERTQAELDKLTAQMKVTEQHYQERKALFGVRLRAIQEEGRISYLSVLFGSHSFSEFVSRFEVLKEVARLDRKLMAEIRTDHEALAEQRTQVESRKAAQSDLKAKAQQQVAVADAKAAEVKALSATLQRRQNELQQQMAEYEKQAALVEQQIWQYQQQLNRKAGRFAPISPLHIPLVVTAWFGPGPDPIRGGQRNHGGTDFAANYGEPIHAIEAGVVIHAGWDDIYGNRVVIDHGGGIASWYGHASQLLVKVGDAVSQDQVIAKIGSTGLSTGPHLHLEIRVNNVRQDPRSYIKF